MIDAQQRRAEDRLVTRRAWGFLAVGLAAAAALAGVALASRTSDAPFHPSASWNMYAPAQWTQLAARTHLAGVHVVAGTAKRDGTAIALLAGRRGTNMCFVPADGFALGRTVCRVETPLVLFPFRDHGWTELVGIARHDVASVAQTSTSSTGPWTSGEPLLPAGGAFVFAGGSGGRVTSVAARDSRGRVLARLSVR